MLTEQDLIQVQGVYLGSLQRSQSVAREIEYSLRAVNMADRLRPRAPGHRLLDHHLRQQIHRALRVYKAQRRSA